MSFKNPITIDVLETLDAIDRRGTFAKAAEELSKATSAVSYTVQKLEEQLDIALFQRQGRRSVLTPAGLLILAEGREILNTAARLANAARELATGWETRIRIAVESVLPYPVFFSELNAFVQQYPGIEIDVQECVLNGGWELLKEGEVDLIVGVPGPAPKHQGYRLKAMPTTELVPVIASCHPGAKLAGNNQTIIAALPDITRVITHDSSLQGIKRSEGLSSEGKHFYVQTAEQKYEAILAGIGVGHLPRERVDEHLKRGELVALNIGSGKLNDNYIAWKIDNKGKGLRALTGRLVEVNWSS